MLWGVFKSPTLYKGLHMINSRAEIGTALVERHTYSGMCHTPVEFDPFLAPSGSVNLTALARVCASLYKVAKFPPNNELLKVQELICFLCL